MSTLARRPKARKTPEERAASIAWHRAVCRGGCVMCRAQRPSKEVYADYGFELRHIEAHHVIAKRHLRTFGQWEHRWDERNGIALCTYHHRRHENHVQRVPRGVLPADALAFARELSLMSLLDREYPPETP